MINQFCCNVLSNSLQTAGQKGYSVIPAKIENHEVGYYFIFQFRSADENQSKDKLIVYERVIKYCPWCGIELSRLVETFKKEISDLAKRNAYLTIKI